MAIVVGLTTEEEYKRLLAAGYDEFKDESCAGLFKAFEFVAEDSDFPAAFWVDADIEQVLNLNDTSEQDLRLLFDEHLPMYTEEEMTRAMMAKEPEGDWRDWLPYSLIQIWHLLSPTARLAAFLVARANMEDAQNYA